MGANSFEIEPPALKSATSTPAKESSVSSCTATSSPSKGSVLPAERAEASSVSLPDGKVALLERLHHLDSDGSGGSNDGDVQIFAHEKGAR